MCTAERSFTLEFLEPTQVRTFRSKIFPFGSRFGSHIICFVHSEVNSSCLKSKFSLHTLFLYTSPSDPFISGGNLALHTIFLCTSWDRFFILSSSSGYTPYFDIERIFPPCNLVLFLNLLPSSSMLTLNLRQTNIGVVPRLSIASGV